MDIVFPTLDEDTPEAPGVVSTWFAQDGASVRAGELLAEVQVSKISGEVTSPADGVLRCRVGEGEVTTQGTVLAQLTTQ